MQQMLKRRLIVLIVLFILSALVFIFLILKNQVRIIDLPTYQSFLNNNLFIKAKIVDNEVLLYTDDHVYSIIRDGINLEELLSKVPVESNQNGVIEQEIAILAVLLIVLLILLLYGRKDSLNRSQQRDESLKNISFETNQTIRFESIAPVRSNITFDDVAGIDEAKEELQEIVDFLKNPDKYKQFGIKLPRGVLLIGPPGVGKTMIAKAVAGEAGVPFFYQSGASFVQIYVGMGAKRVRELFSHAKRFSPAIIFIDEIDAVGKARGAMRNDERESTLNQLLTQMDGFEDSTDIIVIAATNKIELLDEALLRPGRFDRRVFVSLPDISEREDILRVYLKNKNHDVNLNKIAKMTVGFSGASLATLVNEAAINALRRNSSVITESDFNAVKDKVLLGKKRVLSFSEKEKRIQATYQAAKALSAYWFEVEFDKISMLGGSLKSVESEIESKTQMLSKMKVYLSGFVALKLFYNEVYTNSTDDLTKAKQVAEDMINRYGMGDRVIPSIDDRAALIDSVLVEVEKFLENMKEPIKIVEEILIKKESITKEELQRVVSDFL